MKKPTPEIIKIYERNLQRYREAGDDERVRIQQELLKRMKKIING